LLKTAFTCGLSHDCLPAISRTWKAYPLIRMLMMSNVPIGGQPSLSVNAIGVRPSACIFLASAMYWAYVLGAV
jgi:hypothetical protein